jgi:very-short-patch-repair endonuclease
MKRSPRRFFTAIDFARLQRRTANEFASTVWHWVRNRNCCGQKFRREAPIPPYTVDFCCIQLKLVIEVDGAPHLTAAGRAYDARRDRWLRKQGYRVVRIPGFAVLKDPDRVWGALRQIVQERMKNQTKHPFFLPSPRSGGEGSGVRGRG